MSRRIKKATREKYRGELDPLSEIRTSFIYKRFIEAKKDLESRHRRLYVSGAAPEKDLEFKRQLERFWNIVEILERTYNEIKREAKRGKA